MRKVFSVVAIVSFLSACASVSMYVKKEDYKPHGYSEMMIDKNTYLVTYESYKPITFEKTFDLALRRSAELAKSSGFNAFKLLSKKDETKIELVNVPEVVGTISTSWKNGNSFGGEPMGVITPAYTKEFNIKKSTVKIEFSLISKDVNVHLVQNIISK